jgi:hypothetical protein
LSPPFLKIGEQGLIKFFIVVLLVQHGERTLSRKKIFRSLFSFVRKAVPPSLATWKSVALKQ